MQQAHRPSTAVLSALKFTEMSFTIRTKLRVRQHHLCAVTDGTLVNHAQFASCGEAVTNYACTHTIKCVVAAHAAQSLLVPAQTSLQRSLIGVLSPAWKRIARLPAQKITSDQLQYMQILCHLKLRAAC